MANKGNRAKKKRNSSTVGSAKNTSASHPTDQVPTPIDQASRDKSSTPVAAKEIYDKERQTLIDLISANSGDHDKAILQLASAALALSATLSSQVAQSPYGPGTCLLISGWVCLFVSILLMLISFHTGKRACKQQLIELDKWYITNTTPSENQWSACTDYLSLASCIAFVAGIALTLAYLGLIRASSQGIGNVPGVTKQSKNGRIDDPSDTTIPRESHIEGGEEKMSDTPKTNASFSPEKILRAVPSNEGTAQAGYSPPSLPITISEARPTQPTAPAKPNGDKK